jgi:hypothetical protein
MLTKTETSLCPATVKEITGNRTLLVLDDREEWAQTALAFPYEPQVGDRVLAIGNETDTYIVGVLLGRGKTVLNFPGKVELKGRDISIEGSRSLSLKSPQITIQADRFENYSRKVFERSMSVYRWVKDVLQTKAGRVHTHAEGTHIVQAKQIVGYAKKTVKFNGEQIHLG